MTWTAMILLFSIFAGPANGLITQFDPSDSIVQYRPQSHFHGNDTFVFQVTDKKSKSNSAIVNIFVKDNELNDPPSAVSERISTERNKAVIVDVLANDNDPNGDTLTVGKILGPLNGTATINSNESVTFVPLRNFYGSDMFVYNVTRQ